MFQDYIMPPQITTDEELLKRLNKMSEQEIIEEIAKAKKAKNKAGVGHVRIAHRLRKAVTQVSLIERYGSFNKKLIADYISAIEAEILDLKKEGEDV